MESKNQAIEFAKNYLRGEDISNAIHFEDLYSKLIQYEQFGYATEILLEKIADNETNGDEIKLSDFQDLAKNIYKDTTLSSYFKFEKAINVLKSFCDLEHTKNCKTLSLAGEVYKHKWKFDHQFHNLLQSRACYKKGYLMWKNKSHKLVHAETDCINTAVNYAHLNELIVIESLERLSETSEITSETIKRFETAQDISRDIINAYVDDTGTGKPLFRAKIEAKEKLYPALVEAFFGLRRYKEALCFITLHTADKKENWQIKSFSKQIYNLSYYQRIEKTKQAININPFQENEVIEEELNSCVNSIT